MPGFLKLGVAKFLKKGKGISREIFRGSRDFSRQVWGSTVKKFEIPELSICQRRRSFGDDVT